MTAMARRFAVVAAIAFSHVYSISNPGVSRASARYIKFYSRNAYSTSHPRYLSLHSRRPDDYIEAEIVSQTDGKSEKKNNNDQKIEILGIDRNTKSEKKESGGIFNSLASFFGQDEESKQKRERKKKLNTAIDKIFEGSGALGTVFGSLAKGVGGMIAGMTTYCDLQLQSCYLTLPMTQQPLRNSFRFNQSPYTRHQLTSSSSKLQSSINWKQTVSSTLNLINWFNLLIHILISRNIKFLCHAADCVSALGGQINLSMPFTTSSSSSNINGEYVNIRWSMIMEIIDF
jgi:hypothetical protein